MFSDADAYPNAQSAVLKQAKDLQWLLATGSRQSDLCSCTSTCPGMLAIKAACSSPTDNTSTVVSDVFCVCVLSYTLSAVSGMTGLTLAAGADILAESL